MCATTHQKRRKLASLAFVLVGLLGCNRVPREPLAMAIAPLEAAAPLGQATATGDGAGKRSMPELCRAACDHWVRLRFLEPIGYDQLDAEPKATVDALLASQRSTNGEVCRTTCEKRGSRRRAECLLALQNYESSDTCYTAE
jgi:hypothetical protein